MVAVPASFWPPRKAQTSSDTARKAPRRPDLREENRYEGPEVPRVWAAPAYWCE